MAYQNFTPGTLIEEAQDGMGFTIKDNSIWNGESALTSTCVVKISHVNDNEQVIHYDDYALIAGADKSKFNEYLADGHVINTSALMIGGVPAPVIFPDGYYEIITVYSDGRYDAGTEPSYINCQAFLAKYRMMKRMMPAAILAWPMTPAMREKNYDVFAVGLYLEAAEYSADLARKVHFRKFIEVIRSIFDTYSIPQPW